MPSVRFHGNKSEKLEKIKLLGNEFCFHRNLWDPDVDDLLYPNYSHYFAFFVSPYQQFEKFATLLIFLIYKLWGVVISKKAPSVVFDYKVWKISVQIEYLALASISSPYDRPYTNTLSHPDPHPPSRQNQREIYSPPMKWKIEINWPFIRE